MADLTASRKSLGYEPKFDLRRGIDAYFASGALGMTRGLTLASSLAWAAVGISILWGVWITLNKVAALFS